MRAPPTQRIRHPYLGAGPSDEEAALVALAQRLEANQQITGGWFLHHRLGRQEPWVEATAIGPSGNTEPSALTLSMVYPESGIAAGARRPEQQGGLRRPDAPPPPGGGSVSVESRSDLLPPPPAPPPPKGEENAILVILVILGGIVATSVLDAIGRSAS